MFETVTDMYQQGGCNFKVCIECVTIQMKANELFFRVELFIIVY